MIRQRTINHVRLIVYNGYHPVIIATKLDKSTAARSRNCQYIAIAAVMDDLMFLKI